MATYNCSTEQLHLLVFPFPAQGHMLPLLDLAHHLSARGNFAITVVVTPKNLPLLDPILSCSPSIQPLVLAFPDDTGIPPEVENAKDLPPDVSFAQFMLALYFLRPAILNWVKSQAFRFSAMLSDFFLGWTNDLADELGIPRIVFFASGAFMVSVTDYLWHNSPTVGEGGSLALISLPKSPTLARSELPSFYFRYAASAGAPEWEFVRECMLANASSWGSVLNTFDALEGPFLEHLKSRYGHGRVWAVGPIEPAAKPESRGGKSSVSLGELREFLNSCRPRTVVYVCFGSMFKLKPNQAEAIARAFDRSGARFIWAASSDVVLPEGFEERTGKRGLVIRGCAPQLLILGHPAVASFLTHCGWNSVLEGVTAGKILLTWPLGADQFIDMRLLVDYAGTAVTACAGGPDAVPDPEELSRILAESVSENAWPEIWTRVTEMSKKAQDAVKEGGKSLKILETMVNEIVQVNLVTN